MSEDKAKEAKREEKVCKKLSAYWQRCLEKSLKKYPTTPLNQLGAICSLAASVTAAYDNHEKSNEGISVFAMFYDELADVKLARKNHEHK